jgi:hypothetical protein
LRARIVRRELGEGWCTRLGREGAGAGFVVEEGKCRGIGCFGPLVIKKSFMVQEFFLKVF